jgi:hypothetical protein
MLEQRQARSNRSNLHGVALARHGRHGTGPAWHGMACRRTVQLFWNSFKDRVDPKRHTTDGFIDTARACRYVLYGMLIMRARDPCVCIACVRIRAHSSVHVSASTRVATVVRQTDSSTA